MCSSCRTVHQDVHPRSAHHHVHPIQHPELRGPEDGAAVRAPGAGLGVSFLLMAAGSGPRTQCVPDQYRWVCVWVCVSHPWTSRSEITSVIYLWTVLLDFIVCNPQKKKQSASREPQVSQFPQTKFYTCKSHHKHMKSDTEAVFFFSSVEFLTCELNICGGVLFFKDKNQQPAAQLLLPQREIFVVLEEFQQKQRRFTQREK